MSDTTINVLRCNAPRCTRTYRGPQSHAELRRLAQHDGWSSTFTPERGHDDRCPLHTETPTTEVTE